MATFDYRKSKVSIQHGSKFDSIPYVEIDQSTFSYGKTYWQGSGTVEGQKASFKYIGRNMNTDKYKIDKARISIQGLGSSVFSGLKWSYKDFETLTEAELLRKTFKGNDRIFGSRKADIIYGEAGSDKVYGNGGNDKLIGGSGNDRLYGGSGKDVLIGGSGKNYLSGQGGRDTFKVVRGQGYDVIRDFTDGEDRIQLGNGASGLKLSTRGDDVLIHQRGDLLAIVEDSAGDLQRNGNFLI